MVKDKVTTTSSSEETTQEISSTRESKLGSQEKTDPTSMTRGEGLSDTLDDGRESESNDLPNCWINCSFGSNLCDTRNNLVLFSQKAVSSTFCYRYYILNPLPPMSD